MIQYEPVNSPFYLANKSYCETIESKLKSINLSCAGFCNAYGYDLETIFKRGYLTYNLKFHKHQSTQNGGFIPVDAIDYAGIEVTVTGLDKKFSITIGKFGLKRFFTSKNFKDKIPAPYFIKFNYSPDDTLIDNLIKHMLDNKISKFKLSNGTITYKMHTPEMDPLVLIAEIEKTVKNWT